MAHSFEDTYLQADGKTFKNLCGIKHDPERLETVLSTFSADRMAELRDGEVDIPQTFDGAHLRALHHQIFQDVFEWSGSLRSDTPVIEGQKATAIRNMRKAGSNLSFTNAEHIEPELERLSKRLEKSDHLKGLSRAEFAKKSAGILTDLNTIHPFREGNGRVQREFMSQLAENAGHSLDFSVVSHERMYSASVEATGGNIKPMERLMNEISDPVRCAKIRKLTGFFDAQGVEWHPHYVATTEPGEKYRGKFGGGAGDDFFMREDNRIILGNFADVPKGAQTGDDIVITATPMGDQITPAKKKAELDKPKGRKSNDPSLD